LLLMGAVGMSSVMPLREAAVIVGVLTLVNAGIMLTKGWRDVLRPQLVLVLCSSLPMLVVGYFVLDHLASNSLLVLRIVLGSVIIVSCLPLIRPPVKDAAPQSKSSYLFYGAISGIMSGMFSTSGPPLVYHFHRSSFSYVSIRETLVTIFALNAVIRLIVVVGDGAFPARTYWPSLFAVFSVMAGTQLARRLPPPLTPVVMRWTVFVLLAASGISLALPALITILK
jgi:uncharacterized membrane protein YfcA